MLIKRINKKIIALLITLATLATFHSATPAFSEVIWSDAGLVGDKLISGDYEYQELTFITGEPILLKGIVKLPKPIKYSKMEEIKSPYKENFSFDLKSEDGKISLSRQITYEVSLKSSMFLNQTTQERKLTKFSETIKSPDGTFTLGKYNFLEARVYDNTASVDYQSGNMLLEKTLYLNGDSFKNDGHYQVTVDARPIVGYRHYYGGAETQIVKQEIKMVKKDSKSNWSAFLEIGLNSLKKTIFDYQHTDPQNISFRGSFFKYITDENVVSCRYEIIKDGKRSKDTMRFSNKVATEKEALVIPPIRDVAGRAREADITMLAAMQVFEPQNKYFAPVVSISRHAMAKALYITIKGVLPEPSASQITKRYRPGVQTPFLDVPPDAADYHYIKAYKELGIVHGRNRYLKPDELCTRAEAVTMIVRALGLDKVAPAPQYKSSFIDDKNIPSWARDSFYMAMEVGLYTGEAGYAGAGGYVSKEEAAQMLAKLVDHLNNKITPDYREKLINR